MTRPETLRAVLRHLKQFGARELIVTGRSGAGETDDIVRSAGLRDVVEEEGVVFFDHNRTCWRVWSSRSSVRQSAWQAHAGSTPNGFDAQSHQG